MVKTLYRVKINGKYQRGYYTNKVMAEEFGIRQVRLSLEDHINVEIETYTATLEQTEPLGGDMVACGQ